MSLLLLLFLLLLFLLLTCYWQRYGGKSRLTGVHIAKNCVNSDRKSRPVCTWFVAAAVVFIVVFLLLLLLLRIWWLYRMSNASSTATAIFSFFLLRGHRLYLLCIIVYLVWWLPYKLWKILRYATRWNICMVITIETMRIMKVHNSPTLKP